MKMKISVFVLFYCGVVLFQHCLGSNDIILSDVQVEDDDDSSVVVENLLTNNLEPFIPTKEWQVIKPNQAIPAGLHVRMNFQTGIKEAKLLEDENDEKSATSSEEIKGPKIVMSEESKKINEFAENNDKIYFTKSHLKEALQDFRDKVGTKDVDEITWSSDAKKAIEEEMANAERVKKKFRSIDEIKTELEETMRMRIKSDVETMKEMVQYITAKNSTINEICAALDNLEYYVHQIDNGIDLNKIGGLELVVLLLNHTSEDITERAANVLGAATQNNKEVQIAVLKYGGLRLLLQMLYQGRKDLTKKKALYALSTLVRQNPIAQHDLIHLKGVETILNVVRDKSLATSLHVKAIDLLFNLIEEQREIAQKAKENHEVDVEEQYPILKILVGSGLCDMLVPLLKKDDFYTKEKIIHAIKVSVDVCNDTLKQDDHLEILEKELLKLKQNIKEEDDADFMEYLENLRDNLERNILKKLRN